MKVSYIMLLEKIENLHRRLRNNGMAADVNFGGCGHMAITLSHILSKHYGIKNELIFVDESFCNNSINIHKNKYYHNVDDFVFEGDWSHIMVRFRHKGKTYYLDASSIYTHREIINVYPVIFKGSITRGKMIQLSKGIIWNPRWSWNFSTKYCRQIIAEELR